MKLLILLQEKKSLLVAVGVIYSFLRSLMKCLINNKL